MRRVVVTGLGALTAFGHEVEPLWQACLAGATSAEPIPRGWRDLHEFKSTVWSPLPCPDYRQHGFSPMAIKQTDRATLNALLCVRRSLADAGLETRPAGKDAEAIRAYAPARTGVYIGSGVAGVSSFIDSFTHQAMAPATRRLQALIGARPGAADAAALAGVRDTLRHGERFNPFVVSMYMPNSIAAHIGIRYGIEGACNSYHYACASSTIAIGEAFDAIRGGRLDCCLAGGSEYLGDPYGAVFRGFDDGRTLTRFDGSPQRSNRPFDAARSGFLYSEGGAGMLVLESQEHARTRGARIYAEITGYARSFEAHSIMMMKPGGSTIERMTHEVLSQARITPGDVQYVNAHGTGTRANDEIEAQVIGTVFGRRAAVNSTKSILGHALGASGALEAVVTALSVARHVLHPSLNIEEPIADLDFVIEARPTPVEHALSHSFAFGGHNASLLFSHVG
jgi:3-oxoacyl-[acyl-carrier-protein] synthase II